MNFYMLVEGASTEMKVYPRLISMYRPDYRQVWDLDDITDNSYYMFSGQGMPSLYEKIGPSIEDIKEFNRTHKQKIEELVICLDTDFYGDEDETYYRITQELGKCHINNINFTVIMQTMCMETWFLGNREAYPDVYSDDFRPYAAYYNVSEYDPEKMKAPDNTESIGGYSKKYLKRMLNEQNMTYSVNNVRDVTSTDYIRQIDKRYEETGHIHSFGDFKKFMGKL